MSEFDNLKKEIEDVRSQLNNLVLSKKGRTVDPEVAQLSVHLDDLIVRYEKAKSAKRGQ